MSDKKPEPSVFDLAKEILREKNRREKAQDQVEQEGGDDLYDQLTGSISFARRLKKGYTAVASVAKTALYYTGPFGKATMTLWRIGKSAAQYAMFEREDRDFKRDEDGDRIFSGKRLAKSFALAAGIGVAANLGLDYTYYHATQFNELIYTTGKQEILEGELYHVTGCTSLPCSTATDNGKYFQIQKSLFWPRLMYPEQNVYANVPQQIAACDIEGYGLYFKGLKWAFKWAEWYQNIESVSCRPLTEHEIQDMMVAQPSMP